MSRSVWKGPYVDASLLRKVDKMKQSREQLRRISVWSRRSHILPYFVGSHFNIYNGHKWIALLVTEDMVGHKFGEFALTRKIVKHKKS